MVFGAPYTQCKVIHSGGQAALQRAEPAAADRCVRYAGAGEASGAGRVCDADGEG